MSPTAIAFMILGLTITWGGLLLAVRLQVKDSKKNKK